MSALFPFKRLTAFFVLTAFLVSQPGPVYAQKSAISSTSDGAQIPSSLGKIEEFFQAPCHEERCTGKTVFYIQDAHDSLEAQKNITKILDSLIEHQGVQTVFEEGYEGPVPSDSFFGFIKNNQIREKVSYFLLDKLRLGAAEYAHINRKREFRLIGADDLNLHRKNIRAYRKAARHQKEILKETGAAESEIKSLADRFFPKEIKTWMRLKKRFDAEEIPLLDYLKRSREEMLSAVHGETYPLISLLLSAENSRDTALHEKVKNYDPVLLFREIDAFENNFARAFLKAERDRIIFQYYKNLNLIHRLAEMRLSPEEFEAARPAIASTRAQEIADLIARETGKSVVLSKFWEQEISAVLNFYDIALHRDKAAENALKIWTDNSEEKTAALVFGGFHKNRITAALRRHSLSYAVITPALSAKDPEHQAYYKHLMTAGHHSFEKPFLKANADRPPAILMEPESSARAQIAALYLAAAQHPNIPASQLDRYLNLTRFEAREQSSKPHRKHKNPYRHKDLFIKALDAALKEKTSPSRADLALLMGYDNPNTFMAQAKRFGITRKILEDRGVVFEKAVKGEPKEIKKARFENELRAAIAAAKAYQKNLSEPELLAETSRRMGQKYVPNFLQKAKKLGVDLTAFGLKLPARTPPPYQLTEDRQWLRDQLTRDMNEHEKQAWIAAIFQLADFDLLSTTGAYALMKAVRHKKTTFRELDQAVAQDLGLDPSTVSRALTGAPLSKTAQRTSNVFSLLSHSLSRKIALETEHSRERLPDVQSAKPLMNKYAFPFFMESLLGHPQTAHDAADFFSSVISGWTAFTHKEKKPLKGILRGQDYSLIGASFRPRQSGEEIRSMLLGPADIHETGLYARLRDYITSQEGFTLQYQNLLKRAGLDEKNPSSDFFTWLLSRRPLPRTAAETIEKLAIYDADHLPELYLWPGKKVTLAGRLAVLKARFSGMTAKQIALQIDELTGDQSLKELKPSPQKIQRWFTGVPPSTAVRDSSIHTLREALGPESFISKARRVKPLLEDWFPQNIPDSVSDIEILRRLEMIEARRTPATVFLRTAQVLSSDLYPLLLNPVQTALMQIYKNPNLTLSHEKIVDVFAEDIARNADRAEYLSNLFMILLETAYQLKNRGMEKEIQTFLQRLVQMSYLPPPEKTSDPSLSQAYSRMIESFGQIRAGRMLLMPVFASAVGSRPKNLFLKRLYRRIVEEVYAPVRIVPDDKLKRQSKQKRVVPESKLLDINAFEAELSDHKRRLEQQRFILNEVLGGEGQKGYWPLPLLETHVVKNYAYMLRSFPGKKQRIINPGGMELEELMAEAREALKITAYLYNEPDYFHPIMDETHREEALQMLTENIRAVNTAIETMENDIRALSGETAEKRRKTIEQKIKNQTAYKETLDAVFRAQRFLSLAEKESSAEKKEMLRRSAQVYFKTIKEKMIPGYRKSHVVALFIRQLQFQLKNAFSRHRAQRDAVLAGSLSLQERQGEDAEELQTLIEDPETVNPYDQLTEAVREPETRARLLDAIASVLHPRDQMVMRLRYGLDAVYEGIELGYEDIAQIIAYRGIPGPKTSDTSISRERIRQILMKSLPLVAQAMAVKTNEEQGARWDYYLENLGVLETEEPEAVPIKIAEDGTLSLGKWIRMTGLRGLAGKTFYLQISDAVRLEVPHAERYQLPQDSKGRRIFPYSIILTFREGSKMRAAYSVNTLRQTDGTIKFGKAVLIAGKKGFAESETPPKADGEGAPRAETRGRASIHESMVEPLIYPRFILHAPANAPYTRENFFEAPVKPIDEHDRAARVFRTILDFHEKIATTETARQRFRNMLANTTILAVDLPTVFYSPSRPVGIGHVIQISGRRRAILISRKFLEFLDPNSGHNMRLGALYLAIAQRLIEKYDEILNYFRYEDQHGPGIKQIAVIDRLVMESAEQDMGQEVSTFLGPGWNFNPNKAELAFLISADDALWEKERKRLIEHEEHMLENYAAIRSILSNWNAQKGYSDAQIQKISRAIAKIIPGSIPPEVQQQIAQRVKHINWQQPALNAIQRTLQSLQKRGFYYETEGRADLAADYYDKAAQLYKDSQKIDFGGFFPLKAQEELIYFLIRTAGAGGPAQLKVRLHRFAAELQRALKIEYVPEVRRESQAPNHSFTFPIWLTLSVPDLYSKLQYYRPMADEKTLHLIERIENFLKRVYFEELRRLSSEEMKFGVDLTVSKKSKLQMPLLVPVPQSGDVFSFSWKKTELVPGEKIAVRVIAERWLGGPEMRDVAGHFHFVLKKKAGVWKAFSAEADWAKDPLKPVPGSPLVVDPVILDQFENLPHLMTQLGLRLARKSGAVSFELSMPPALQLDYGLPYLNGQQKHIPQIRIGNLQNSRIFDTSVRLKPRTSPRHEARNIDKDLKTSSETPASLFIPYRDFKTGSPEKRRVLFALASEVKFHRETSLVIYGADLTDESLKPFREAGVHILSEDLAAAWKLFGQKSGANHNVHFSARAEVLKRNLGEPLLAFLFQNPEDVYAAILFARSGGKVSGVENKNGIYSLVDSAFAAAVLKHFNDLAVAIAA